MNAWENAVNKDFIDNLIDEIERLKSEYEDSDRNKEYYQEIGKLVCGEIYATMGKDLEL